MRILQLSPKDKNHIFQKIHLENNFSTASHQSVCAREDQKQRSINQKTTQ